MKEKLKTPKDKIDFCIFLIHYLLFVLAIVAIISNIVILFISYRQGLTNYSKESIINLLLSLGIIFSFFTFDKFKAVRKKFLKEKSEGNLESKESEKVKVKGKKSKKVKKGKKK